MDVKDKWMIIIQYIQFLAREQASSEPRKPPPIITIFLQLGLLIFSSNSRKSCSVL